MQNKIWSTIIRDDQYEYKKKMSKLNDNTPSNEQIHLENNHVQKESITRQNQIEFR